MREVVTKVTKNITMSYLVICISVLLLGTMTLSIYRNFP